MERFEIIALTMAVLVTRPDPNYDIENSDELARRAEDLVDAAERRAAETVAYRKAAEALDASETADLASPAEPPELDQHGRAIKK